MLHDRTLTRCDTVTLLSVAVEKNLGGSTHCTTRATSGLRALIGVDRRTPGDLTPLICKKMVKTLIGPMLGFGMAVVLPIPVGGIAHMEELDANMARFVFHLPVYCKQASVQPPIPPRTWTVYTDGSRSGGGVGTGVWLDRHVGATLVKGDAICADVFEAEPTANLEGLRLCL